MYLVQEINVGTVYIYTLFSINLGLKDEVLELLNFVADSWPNRFPIEKICELYTHDCMGQMPGYPTVFGHVGENT